MANYFHLHVSRFFQIACILSMTLAAGTVAAAVAYEEHWDAGDTNGWVMNTTSSTVLRDNGVGNPAASIVTRRSLSPPVFEIGATTELPAASGDYTGEPSWMVSFDVFYDLGAFTDTRLRFRFQDPTFNGWYKSVANSFPAAWESYSETINPTWTDGVAAANGWVDETGGTISWQQLMTDVYHPEVRILLGDENSAIAHIDNFVLKPVPEPSTWVVLLLGMAIMLIGNRTVVSKLNSA